MNEIKKEAFEYSGPTFEELTAEEMVAIQGSGDVQAETTPICVLTVANSVGWVAPGVATGVTIVVSLKSC